jgi:hypothetical protein
VGFWTLSIAQYSKNAKEHDVLETGSESILGREVGVTCSLGSVRKNEPQLVIQFLKLCVVLCFRNTGQWIKSKNPVILSKILVPSVAFLDCMNKFNFLT